MDAALSHLRRMGIRILNYLNDWLILAQSQAVLTSQTLLLSHLGCLGLRVNFAKSIPSQWVSFLGFSSTIKVYAAAIAAFHASIAGRSVGRDVAVIQILRGMNPLRPRTVSPWDLPTVLRALKGSPFEPLQSSSLRVLSLKIALLLALASVKRVGDLQALSVNPSCLEFGPNDSKVVLKLRLGFVPKVLSTPFRAQVIALSTFFPPVGNQESLLCPVRALKIYIERSASYRSQNSFCFNCAKGGPVTKKRNSRWLVDVITLAYSSIGSRCPIGRGQSPLHQRHHLFLGMVQRGVHVRHLWGGRLVLAVHICKVLQPGCPCGADHSLFCLIANFRVHLTNVFQVPSFAWSVHKLYRHQVSLWDNTRATDEPLGSPCALCILQTPLGLIPRESWVRVVPHHSTGWLDWFPYSVFDAVRV